MSTIPSGRPLRPLIQRAIEEYENAPVALFDAAHGQPNWAQTGFVSREMHSNFAGMTEILCRMGFRCQTTGEDPLEKHLPNSKLLVIPPPTGHYDRQRQRWRPAPELHFTVQEIRAIVDFVASGGRLLAFAYRFGDSFTHANLFELMAMFGCQLNNDVVLDARNFRDNHPLQLHFDTPRDLISAAWAREKTTLVRWRPMATFSILPGYDASPIVHSPGGHSISFDRRMRQISFAQLPIAVAGLHGSGRFEFFGGPHAFETGPLGLLRNADNACFLQNVLKWLNSSERSDFHSFESTDRNAAKWSKVENQGEGARMVASVERVLRRSGISSALSKPHCVP